MPAILQESSVNSLAVHPENTAENFTTGLYPPVSRLQPPFRIRFRARNHPIIIFSPSKRRAENLKFQKILSKDLPGYFPVKKLEQNCCTPQQSVSADSSKFPDLSTKIHTEVIHSAVLSTFFSPISFQWILLHHTETMI